MTRVSSHDQTVLVCPAVSLCSAACAEVDSDTEAVAGQSFELGCLSCKMRGEVEATATVDWHFRARGEADFVHVSSSCLHFIIMVFISSTFYETLRLGVLCRCQIYSYDGETANIIHEQFQDRVEWHGSRNTLDLQDATVDLHNVTFNDSGVYRCVFNRVLNYGHYEYSTIASKEVHLTVVPKGERAVHPSRIRLHPLRE